MLYLKLSGKKRRIDNKNTQIIYNPKLSNRYD